MALNVQLTNLAANAEADAIAALCNSGKLRIYSGTQPATGDTALSGNTLLAELTLNATAFAAAVAGVATANAITSDASADATGTASFFRIFKSDGTTAVLDGTVGTGTHNLVVATTAFVAGAVISVSSLTITAPKA